MDFAGIRCTRLLKVLSPRSYFQRKKRQPELTRLEDHHMGAMTSPLQHFMKGLLKQYGDSPPPISVDNVSSRAPAISITSKRSSLSKTSSNHYSWPSRPSRWENSSPTVIVCEALEIMELRRLSPSNGFRSPSRWGEEGKDIKSPLPPTRKKNIELNSATKKDSFARTHKRRTSLPKSLKKPPTL